MDGEGGKEKRDESETETKGMRGVSVTGLRGEEGGKDVKGRKEGMQEREDRRERRVARR